MAQIIDLGLKKPDDPIFTEGIRIISIRKLKPQTEPLAPKESNTNPTSSTKETPREPQT